MTMMLMITMMMMIIIIIITIKPMEYEEKGDLIILIVRTHQQHKFKNTTDSYEHQGKLQRRSRQIKEIIAEKTKENIRGKGCTNNSHVTETKKIWIRNYHISC